MICSFEHNAAFFDLPKTASNAMRKALVWNYNFFQFKGELRLFGRECVQRLDTVSRHRFICPQLDQMRTAAFVRHPFDRLASGFRFCQSNSQIPHTMKFSEFVDLLGADTFPFTVVWHCFLHLTQLICVDLIPQAQFIGRFEKIAEDWPAACRHMGIEPVDLPHTNLSGLPTDYRAWYTPEMEAKVRAFFADDFAAFYPED